MLKQLLLIALICLATVAPAAAQTDRFLALVVSGDGGTARADAVQDHLQTMGAETLRAVSPNNAQLRSILKRFGREAAGREMRGLILDLRSNPGGYLNQAIAVCDRFLEDGIIVSTVEAGGDRLLIDDPHRLGSRVFATGDRVLLSLHREQVILLDE